MLSADVQREIFFSWGCLLRPQHPAGFIDWNVQLKCSEAIMFAGGKCHNLKFPPWQC